jgi:hypothetical protein
MSEETAPAKPGRLGRRKLLKLGTGVVATALGATKAPAQQGFFGNAPSGPPPPPGSMRKPGVPRPLTGPGYKYTANRHGHNGPMDDTSAKIVKFVAGFDASKLTAATTSRDQPHDGRFDGGPHRRLRRGAGAHRGSRVASRAASRSQVHGHGIRHLDDARTGDVRELLSDPRHGLQRQRGRRPRQRPHSRRACDWRSAACDRPRIMVLLGGDAGLRLGEMWRSNGGTSICTHGGLFAPGDERRSGARDPGAGRPRGSLDDAVLHAPESGGDRRRDSVVGRAEWRSEPRKDWRHSGRAIRADGM